MVFYLNMNLKAGSKALKKVDEDKRAAIIKTLPVSQLSSGNNIRESETAEGGESSAPPKVLQLHTPGSISGCEFKGSKVYRTSLFVFLLLIFLKP